LVEYEDLREEEWRLGKLKFLVDGLCYEIVTGRLGPGEARQRAKTVREQARKLIPDRMDLFDLVYGARFERLIAQFLES